MAEMAKTTIVPLLTLDNGQRIEVPYDTAVRCLSCFPGLYEATEGWKFEGGRLTRVGSKKEEK